MQILNFISIFALNSKFIIIIAIVLAGLYIHIPFCKSRCIYCAFYSTTGLNLRQRYVDALCREIEFRAHNETQTGTIYLGGGTPSQLTMAQLYQIFKAIYIYNKVIKNAEVTIEVNPDDVTEAFVDGLKSLPINRVSMGAQTFDDERLHFLHRRHTSAQVRQAVQLLRHAGIHNISIDLMYGFPKETISDWQHDIDAALSLDVEHLSAYCLTLEEGTPLYRMMNKGDEEKERQMYELLIDKLTAAGYEHYEISNFAKQGYRSRHNSSYWHDVPYIGIGAAAHSYDGSCRQWNVADIHQYISAIERNEIPFEQEFLDDDTRYNDRITVALRTIEGLDLTPLSSKHRSYCLNEAEQFLNNGLLCLRDNHLILTREGLFVSDYIMSTLVIV